MTTTRVRLAPPKPAMPRWARGLGIVAAAVAVLAAGCASVPPGAAPSVATAPADVPHGMSTVDQALPLPSRPVPAEAQAATAPAAAATVAATETADAPAAAGAVVAIDPLSPTVALNLDDSAARTDLWARVRSGLAVPDMDNALVRKWEQWYAGKPDYVQRMTERGGRYLFHVMEEVNRRGLPSELALLPFIESAFNPQAMSSAKASGMWQFVPATGRDFSLRQNVFRDDRRSVLESTRAALAYLSGLHDQFGDWQLALAAYNWGQGNVLRAIKRNQAAGLPTDYDSLRMPDETRNYYPKLQAVKNIVRQPEAFALALPPLRNHPYFVSVGLDRDIDIDVAARMAKLPLDEFKALNPQMNKPVILAAGTPQVLLPYDNANVFVKALSERRGVLATWTAWVAPRTMKAAEAARVVGMDEDHLRQVNAIPARMLVKAGSTLLVPRDPRVANDVAEHVADNATLALAPDVPPFKRVAFKAGKKGDTVAAVARRYHLNPTQVAQWNHTSANGRFKRGETVVVMVPVRAGAVMAKARRGAGATAVAQAGAEHSKASRAGHAVHSTRVAATAHRGARSVVRVAARSGGGKRPSRPGPAARTRSAQG